MVRRTTPRAQTEKNAWPVVVRILIPENGLASVYRFEDDIWRWLDRHIGKGEYWNGPHECILGDATAFHFRTIDDARAFVTRFPKLVLADGTMAGTYTSPDHPFGRKEVSDLCNLYTHTRTQEAMRRLFAEFAPVDRLGNLPELPEIYPDYLAPILRNTEGGTELVMARWGLPSPPQYLMGKKADRGVTNVRNPASPYWRRWLRPANRCLVPFTAFAEPNSAGGNAWFDLPEDIPAVFAGIHVPGWTSVRKVKDGETTDDLFAFLTTEPNALVGAVHPKAMPVILTDPVDWRRWLTAPWPEAAKLQRPLSDGLLVQTVRA